MLREQLTKTDKAQLATQAWFVSSRTLLYTQNKFPVSCGHETRLGKVVRHSCDNPGYKTHIIRYIDADKTVILLCNNAHEQYGDILKGIESFVE